MNLFLLDLAKEMEELDIIPENLEKFKAVFTENFTFLDSFAFLSSSLDKLSKNLQDSGYDKFERLKIYNVSTKLLLSQSRWVSKT